MLWTYSELKILHRTIKLFIKRRVPMSVLKEELRWLDKKLQDRVEEVCSGLIEDTESIPLEEELAELLEGEEEEVISVVKERWGGKNETNNT